MAAVLEPRGPDGEGERLRGGAGLIHRRLKIIDLSERGAQPMHDPRTETTIVFNGCIYNHHELRAELEGLGHAFRSTSDTEVLLLGWAQWGEGLLERLKGMFAFALLEERTGRLVLVRDRLGIKLLYLADLPGGGLRAASTLPALLEGGGVDTAIDPVALHHYLSWHSVVPAPRTILRGVRKLPPATVLTIEPDGRRRERRYWDPLFARDPERSAWSAEDWTDAVRAGLEAAVRRRMVADVPVGVLLSGGLDSSLIVAMLAEQGQRGLTTFSIGFPDVGDTEGDEFAYSDVVAREFGTDHHKLHVDAARLLPAGFGPQPPQPPRRPRAPPPRGPKGDPREERADGPPRRRRFLPAQRGGGQARQGRAEGAGRRGGLRRLPLVPAAARGRRRR